MITVIQCFFSIDIISHIFILHYMSIKMMLILLTALVSASAFLYVDGASSLLRDQNNRIRVMHGLNVVYKQFPFYPTRDGFNSNYSLVAQDFVNLKNWGINSLRLYIAWEGFEPKRHQYNYTYLEVLRDIVRQAQSYGISVVLDAHHDLYSRKFCGQGFPTWLGEASSFPLPLKVKLRKDSQGFPLKQDCMKIGFFKYYISYDVVTFSHDFFTNKNGMNDKFIEMWLKVVEYFKSEKNVIGYDIINEPTGGNFWANPYSFLGPDQDNNRILLPFYKKASQKIREIEKDRLLLFEPAPQDMIGGFYQPFSSFKSKDLLNYHTYCPFALGTLKCQLYNSIYTKRRQQNAKKLGIAGIISEFGSVSNTAQGLAQIKSVTQNADKYLTSWYYWQFKYNMDSTCSTNPPWLFSFYYPNSTLQLQKVKALSYSYAYAICGRFINQTTTQGSYLLNYFPADCQGKYTQLFLNAEFDFADGFVVKFSPACDTCRLRLVERGYYEVIVDNGLLGRAFSVRVGAKIRGAQQND